MSKRGREIARDRRRERERDTVRDRRRETDRQKGEKMYNILKKGNQLVS